MVNWPVDNRIPFPCVGSRPGLHAKPNDYVPGLSLDHIINFAFKMRAWYNGEPGHRFDIFYTENSGLHDDEFDGYEWLQFQSMGRPFDYEEMKQVVAQQSWEDITTLRVPFEELGRSDRQCLLRRNFVIACAKCLRVLQTSVIDFGITDMAIQFVVCPYDCRCNGRLFEEGSVRGNTIDLETDYLSGVWQIVHSYNIFWLNWNVCVRTFHGLDWGIKILLNSRGGYLGRYVNDLPIHPAMMEVPPLMAIFKQACGVVTEDHWHANLVLTIDRMTMRALDMPQQRIQPIRFLAVSQPAKLGIQRTFYLPKRVLNPRFFLCQLERDLYNFLQEKPSRSSTEKFPWLKYATGYPRDMYQAFQLDITGERLQNLWIAAMREDGRRRVALGNPFRLGVVAPNNG